MPDLILASGSPRRALLLSTAGYTFRVERPDVDESHEDGEEAAALVLRLAEEKALAVSRSTEDVVLAADTVVVLDGTVMGKPADREDAVAMLTALSGATHSVLTGWTLLAGSEQRYGVHESRVEFNDLSPAEIDAYIDDVQPWDKAGSYAIQGDSGHLIRQVSGSRANVMGLPLGDVAEGLTELGIIRSPAAT